MVKLRAGLVVALTVMIVTGFLILSQRNRSDVGETINTLVFSLFPLVGAVLLARHPRNPVGYLVSMMGLAVLGAGTLFEYALTDLRQPDAGFPLTGEAAWAALSLWNLVLPCLVSILLLFPSGRLPAPRWKALAIFTMIISLPMLFATMFVAWRSRELIIRMELGVIPFNASMAALYRAYDIWNLALIIVIILAVISFFTRFRRSSGIERQQLKWFVFGMSSIPLSMVLDELMMLIDTPLIQGLNWTLNIISIAAFPVVMLIAMTRYRLYDIDFIIRRTLLYSALTLTLGLIYFSVVLSAQALFTRQFGEQPEFVIVFSTLLIAALFQPLRRRFQSIINRRFYRRNYDSEQTLQRFAALLQNEVNLDEIERAYVAIVKENIQPEHVELWLLKKYP